MPMATIFRRTSANDAESPFHPVPDKVPFVEQTPAAQA